MRILVLGGTVFLGRHLVEQALEAGHEVTLFNRGRYAPELFPEVERLRGDRDGGLDALAGRRWDAAVDTSGYVPRLVRASAEALAGSVERYTFVSTIAALDLSGPGRDESAQVQTLADPTVEEVTGPTYAGLKALCERVAEDALPGRVLTIRPGLIVGPHDPTGRFAYWPQRIARGGEVVAPGRPERQVQFIDARDLAAWTLRMVEAGCTGVYNATGPEHPLTMGELLETCRAVTGSDARFVWVSEEILVEHRAGAWSELPLWMPETNPALSGFTQVDCRKALGDGLVLRPVAEIVRDSLAWAESGVEMAPQDHGLPRTTPGLTPEREAELLAAARARA